MRPNSFHSRLQQLQSQIGPSQLWLASRSADVSYLTGLQLADVPGEREALLILGREKAHLLLHQFMESPVQWPANAVTRSVVNSAITAEVVKLCQQLKVTEVQVDLSNLTAIEYQQLQKTILSLPAGPVQLTAWDRAAIKKARSVKDADELKQITAAISVAQQVAKRVRGWLKVGITEIELATKINLAMLRLGSAGSAFPTLVAFGVNTCQPHHLPNYTRLELNQPVLVDFGALVNGYRSDLTRSWWFGPKRPAEYWQAWQAVRAAFRAGSLVAINTINSPTAQQVDQAVRQVLRQQQLEKFFMHTSGHGLGLEIHESPSLRADDLTPLRPGMVITVEPGVYLPNQFGVRWEETLIVQA